MVESGSGCRFGVDEMVEMVVGVGFAENVIRDRTEKGRWEGGGVKTLPHFFKIFGNFSFGVNPEHAIGQNFDKLQNTLYN